MIHQAPEIFHLLFAWAAGPHPQHRGGFPDVAPSAGEHARADGLLSPQEPKDVFKDSIRQGFNALADASQPAAARHH